jgi:hypothetical protein
MQRDIFLLSSHWKVNSIMLTAAKTQRTKENIVIPVTATTR